MVRLVIVWDEPKRLANLEKHRIDLAEIGASFFESALVVPAHSGRLRAIGLHEERLVSIVFKVLGSEGISIISARPANEKDREAFESR